MALKCFYDIASATV